MVFLYLFHFLRFSILFPSVPLYCHLMGFSPAKIGIIVSAHSLLSIPLAIPLGRLLDKFSPIIGIRLGFILNFISSILLIFLKNFYGVLFSQLIGGLGFLFIVVGSQSAISRFGDFSKKANLFSKLALYGAIGQSIGPYIGGLIIAKFNFYVLFLVSLVLSIPGIFISKSQKFRKTTTKYDIKYHSLLKEINIILRSKKITLILLFTGLAVFVTTLRSSFFPIFLKELSLKPDTIGLLISIFSIIMSIIRIFVGRFLRKEWFSKLMLLTITSFAIGLFLIPFTQKIIFITLGIIMWGCGFGISQPLSMLLMSENISKSISGLGMGIRFTAITTAAFIAPIIFGFIVEYFGLSQVFYFSSFLCTVFVLYYLIIEIRHNFNFWIKKTE